ncbi:molecular chaperone HtpG [Wolbachia endosymbiont of Howardula sp.]|uniref:molecular chaperone HtpG n=1 Tax=Wolbachia endosymbiont of Howardula sp. TaxID=2916816 RepID=UPI00217CD61D|nr:molecular chaperone HtpG [Wolbachia endosymbiont of Howardula sp.]UWI83276.1 molecular chaperone HtpG [Wolbachia endosymbiont of Howardula sp.]
MHNIKDTENLQFDTEVSKILNIVIHALYTNKDIFLRELVSNASDACDKLRYESQLNSDLLSVNDELKISISFNKDKSALYITDNGIGMNRQDLIDHLGTIASSGTQKFLENIKNTKDAQKNIDVIGKFGVGFYSSFMVASEVIVQSRKAGEEETWMWTSKGDGGYSISKLENINTHHKSGTKITLILHAGEHEFLNQSRIKNIITTYSDHITFPIEFIDEEQKKSEKLNSNASIWTKSKKEITQEEYNAFFRYISNMNDNPWMTLHNKSEGIIEYTNLLYIPSVKPFDLFHPDRNCSVRLYVNKVFITENNVQIIPQYLRFLRGIVDSPDLPLNISRETLQNNRVVDQIKKSITKRVLSEISKRAQDNIEEYINFWSNFGAVLKEGLCDSLATEDREMLLSICRFHSTKYDTLVSLDDYISRMTPDQSHIYYLTGNSLTAVKNSPQLEGFINKGLEVLLFIDPVDDFWTSVIRQYKHKEFKSVTRSGVDIEKFSLEKQNQNQSNIENNETILDNINSDPIIKYFTKVLGTLIKEVRVSKKLIDSPVCLTVDEGGIDLRMERFLREQKQLDYRTPKVLEINLKHIIVKNILNAYNQNGENQILEDIIYLLFYQACIIEGEEIDSPHIFTNRLNNILASILMQSCVQ